MASKFNMAELVSSLTGQPSEGQQQLQHPTPAQAAAQAPQRARVFPRGPLPTSQQREEARDLAQQHRAYAEAWFQVLRGWEVQHHNVPLHKVSYAFARGYEPISTMGEGGAIMPTALLTPVGQMYEFAVGRMITDMAASPVPDRQGLGLLLERVRSGQAPASLLREGGGWAYPAPRMAGYAVAVLTLAVAMGDGEAQGPLRYAGAVMRRGEGE